MKTVSDTELIDWMQSLMSEGRLQRFMLSDSRDMGYKRNFLALFADDAQKWPYLRGDTVREVLTKAYRLNKSRKVAPK